MGRDSVQYVILVEIAYISPIGPEFQIWLSRDCEADTHYIKFHRLLPIYSARIALIS
jgi:hypothetical protein